MTNFFRLKMQYEVVRLEEQPRIMAECLLGISSAGKRIGFRVWSFSTLCPTWSLIRLKGFWHLYINSLKDVVYVLYPVI